MAAFVGTQYSPVHPASLHRLFTLLVTYQLKGALLGPPKTKETPHYLLLLFHGELEP